MSAYMRVFMVVARKMSSVARAPLRSGLPSLRPCCARHCWMQLRIECKSRRAFVAIRFPSGQEALPGLLLIFNLCVPFLFSRSCW